MADKVLVSIIALNYNQSGFLIESLDAIASQSFKNFEIIITDDSSKDDSRTKIDMWVAQHPELNITKLYNESNIGLCKTLNRAIYISNGRYIKPIACDDVLDDSYLEKAVRLFENSPNVSLICSDMMLIDENSNIKQQSNWQYAQVRIEKMKINEFDEHIEGPFLNTPSITFKRDLFDKIGGYDEDLIFEDWDFILRAKRIADFAYINESLVSYRMHDTNMHKNIGIQIQYSEDIVKLLQKHWGISERIDSKIKKRISDEIFSMLLIDENRAIEIWQNLYGKIKLTEKRNLPLLSVLTSVYNAENFIAHAIESILLQTYTNIQLVIVTDPCTDHTIDIIKSYLNGNPNIVLVQNEKHLGIISSFNIGLTYCQGDFVARMDLDDLIHPQRFEKQMKFLSENKDIDVVSAWMKVFDENKNVRNVTYRSDFEVNKISMLFYSPISHAASVFKTQVLKKTGYIEDYKYAEDYDLWFRIMKNYRIAVMPEYLYLYRTHSNQVTNEKNLHISKESLRKIGINILNEIGMVYSIQELEFHLEYLMMNKPLNSVGLFIQYDEWLSSILKANKKSGFFVEQKFKDFVFTNYWQKEYITFRKELKFNQVIKIQNSPFNLYGKRQKTKDILKSILRK